MCTFVYRNLYEIVNMYNSTLIEDLYFENKSAFMTFYLCVVVVILLALPLQYCIVLQICFGFFFAIQKRRRYFWLECRQWRLRYTFYSLYSSPHL